MKKQRVLLLGGNYYPEPTGIGKYNGDMMDWLSGEGHECTVVTSYPYYPYWKIQEPYTSRSASWYGKEKRSLPNHTDITIYRCPHYIPAKPSGAKRMLSDLSFCASAFFRVFVLLFAKKYDYVIAVAPPFNIGFLGLFYKWFRGGKFIYHVQDLQIDAAKDLEMIRSNFLLNIMFSAERFILKRATFISSISDGMISRLKVKSGKPVLFFPNWADTKAFHPLKDKAGLKRQFGLSPEDTVVLYSGAIGEKQGLEDILFAAQSLEAMPIQFVICGSGPYKEQLILRTQEMGLKNVQFLPLQPREIFNEFLNMADIHLVLQKANASDLVMPSKLTTILSVGGFALVTATQGSSLYNMIREHKMGAVIEPENQAALIEAIKTIASGANEAACANARQYAEMYLDIDKVMERFLGEISETEKIVPRVVIKEKTEDVSLISKVEQP